MFSENAKVYVINGKFRILNELADGSIHSMSFLNIKSKKDLTNEKLLTENKKTR